MARYFLKRIGLAIPTLFGITLICFVFIQLVPGGPIDQAIAQWRNAGMGGETGGGQTLGITEEARQALIEYYGFDKPVIVRYFDWLSKVAIFDFGDSYSYEEPVVDLIIERLPVSITFGIVGFLATYLVCIPLGILKALRHNTWADWMSSGIIFFLYSIPSFALAILLLVYLCGGTFWNIFPIEGFTSDNFEELSLWGKFLDIAHHMFLPIVCYTINNFAMLTMLMKNSLMDQLKQDYVTTARAKGLEEKLVIVRHAVRNALLPIANGFGQWIGIFFAGSIVIEMIFGLQGIGLLSYEAVINRDYPVVMANILIVSVVHIVGNIISDFLYVVIDPRISYS